MSFCANCGKEISDKDWFCVYCGANVKSMKNTVKLIADPIEKKDVAVSYPDNYISGWALDTSKKSVKKEERSLRPVKKEERSVRAAKKGNGKAVSKNITIALLSVLVFALIIVASIGPVMNFLGKYNVNHPGKVYYSATDQEDIATRDDGFRYADNEILVVAENNVSRRDISKLAEQYDAVVVGEIEQTGDYQWRFKDNSYSYDDLKDLIDKVASESVIKSAEYNFFFSYNDFGVKTINSGDKWSKDTAWNMEAINAPEAWEFCDRIGSELKPVRVGIVDVSFDPGHEDLKNCMAAPVMSYEKRLLMSDDYNDRFIYYIDDRTLKKETGYHGTAVAGIMAADGQNSEGICGVYPYAKDRLYCIDRLSPSDESYGEYGDYRYGNKSTSVSFFSLKCNYADLILRDVKVINCSYGIGYSMYYHLNYDYNERHYEALGISLEEAQKKDEKIREEFLSDITECSHAYGDFYQRLLDLGYEFVVVVAAGNESNSEFDGDVCFGYDSSEKKKINEEKINNTGWVDAQFSDLHSFIGYDGEYQNIMDRIIVVGSLDKGNDVQETSCVGNRVDLYAPGEEIYTTTPFDKYGVLTGSSLAAPHVSGAAALLFSIDNTLKGDDVKRILKGTSVGKTTEKAIEDNYRTLDLYEAVKCTYDKEYNSFEEDIDVKDELSGHIIDLEPENNDTSSDADVLDNKDDFSVPSTDNTLNPDDNDNLDGLNNSDSTAKPDSANNSDTDPSKTSGTADDMVGYVDIPIEELPDYLEGNTDIEFLGYLFQGMDYSNQLVNYYKVHPEEKFFLGGDEPNEMDHFNNIITILEHCKIPGMEYTDGDYAEEYSTTLRIYSYKEMLDKFLCVFSEEDFDEYAAQRYFIEIKGGYYYRSFEENVKEDDQFELLNLPKLYDDITDESYRPQKAYIEEGVLHIFDNYGNEYTGKRQEDGKFRIDIKTDY